LPWSASTMMNAESREGRGPGAAGRSMAASHGRCERTAALWHLAARGRSAHRSPNQVVPAGAESGRLGHGHLGRRGMTHVAGLEPIPSGFAPLCDRRSQGAPTSGVVRASSRLPGL
jgi:hypothetical protein